MYRYNTTDQPLVSVCIPTFNSEKYISNALASVINQTYQNLEIIIVDNFSTDKTVEIVNNFYDHRINIYQLKNHGCIAASRNFASKKSNGKWIAFLDSDDLWTKNKIECCAKYFTDKVDLIYHNLMILENNQLIERRSMRSKKLRRPVFYNLIMYGNTIATSSVVVRTSILKRVNWMNESQNMIGVEDYNTWLKISRVSNGFKLVKKDLGFYRIHEDNFSNAIHINPSLSAIQDFLVFLSPRKKRRLFTNYKYAEIRSSYYKNSMVIEPFELIKNFNKVKGLDRLKILYMFSVSLLKNNK